MSMPHFPPWTPAACICVDLVSDNDCPVHGPTSEHEKFWEGVPGVNASTQAGRPIHPVQAAQEDCQNEIPLSQRLDHDGAQYRAEQRKIEFVKPGVEIGTPEEWSEYLTKAGIVGIDTTIAHIARLEQEVKDLKHSLDQLNSYVLDLEEELDQALVLHEQLAVLDEEGEYPFEYTRPEDPDVILWCPCEGCAAIRKEEGIPEPDDDLEPNGD